MVDVVPIHPNIRIADQDGRITAGFLQWLEQAQFRVNVTTAAVASDGISTVSLGVISRGVDDLPPVSGTVEEQELAPVGVMANQNEGLDPV